MKFGDWQNFSIEKYIKSGRASKIVTIATCVALGLIGAKAITGFVVVKLSGFAIPAKTKVASQRVPDLIGKFNYHTAKGKIVDRNLFNSDGEYPDETEVQSTDGEEVVSEFNMSGPCTKPSIDLTLIGTIYSGNDSTSLATVQEKGIASADIYKVGDIIIGSDNSEIVKIEKNRVVMNNAGKKECLEIDTPGQVNRDEEEFDDIEIEETADAAALGEVKDTSKAEEKAKAPGASCDGTLSVEAEWVESELGVGYSKILNSARMVPNAAGADGSINGFKIFSIVKGSLLDKLCIRNGDVIQEVNNISLTQPDQGFAFYKSLQEDENIQLKVLRSNGNTDTISILIK